MQAFTWKRRMNHSKPFQFRLGRLFRSIALVALIVAVASRVAADDAPLVQAVFPIAASLGVVMIVFTIRHVGAR